MWLNGLFFLPCFMALAAACPCNFDNDLGEVTCDAGTQDMLPFSLPDCLSVENDQVQRLILAEQNFPHVISGSFLLFQSLRYLDLSYSNIATIDEFAFDVNSKLNNIILRGNGLVSLPALFQSPVNSLQSITLRHNKLESMDARNLDHLVVLDLDDNLMTETGITQTLAHLPNLYEISLDSNRIATIDKNMFSKQEKIEVISLWNNKIVYIQPGSFDHLVKIQSIDLKSNILTEYRTESWHFCHSLTKETLEVKLEDNKKVTQDLKIDAHTESFCSNTNNGEPSVSTSCLNENGHLSCSGNIEDLLCELRGLDFKSITFMLHKDENTVNVADFFEAETNTYFKEINQVNGKSNLTKYLSDLKLYGTKFDLATLDEHVGLRTKTVTIFADTIYMSRPLENPIKSQISMRARVVSISEDIPMNMTRQQFFENLNADQPVDNWASVQEVISGVGNASFEVKKLGFIEVQKALPLDSLSYSSKLCSPRIFDVQEYETEHHTLPAVFFDRVQLNLLRMGVRTLASTKSNDVLAMEMADHSLLKTTDSTIVMDKKAYIVAQKLIRDKEILTSHKQNVPFYETAVMSALAKIMFDKMSLYAANETMLMLKLDNALGRMTDMNKNFEEARLMRELYFERELATLEAIWNSTDAAWNWSFNASRDMEQNIQDSIQKNGEEMFQMEENEMEEMLARAEATVESDQAVVDKFKAEIDRYSQEAQLSLDLQRQKLNETNKAGTAVEAEKGKFDDSIEEWKEEQMRKAFFGFLTAMFGIIVGMATMQPEIAGAGVAAGAAEAGAAGAEIAEVMASIEELISALAALEEMLDAISGIGDIDVHIPDLGSDIALGTAINWRAALENAYYMKNMTSKFSDIEILGQTKVASVGPATENEVDPAGLQQAMSTYNDRGSQLIQETVNFAQLMMHLADLSGDLEVAELDLQIAIEQVHRVEQMLEDLKAHHDEYVEWMNQHRDDYQDKCDEFANAYNTTSTADKEAFKQQIVELFEKFKQAFEESNNQYVAMMNELTTALYTKVASVKQHSMVQRSMIMNLYQDFCDGLFYFSFTECYNDNPAEQYVPTMSDGFGTLLGKLNEIQWDSITSMESFPNLPSPFSDVSIILMDEQVAGFNSSSQMFGAATSLRETGEAYFNFNNHNDYLDDFYRVRIDSIKVHLLDSNGEIFKSPANDIMRFIVYLPLEFNDKDAFDNVYAFRAMKHFCPADYFIKANGEIQTISSCEVDHEFDGVNHKTSHDGVFKIVAKNMPQEILNQVGGIKVTVGGSYATKGKELF